MGLTIQDEMLKSTYEINIHVLRVLSRTHLSISDKYYVAYLLDSLLKEGLRQRTSIMSMAKNSSQ